LVHGVRDYQAIRREEVAMRSLLAACGLLFLAACAVGGASSGGDTGDVVTGEQLRATGETNVESAIRELRPQWFTAGRESTGTDRSGGIVVCRGTLMIYVDGESSRRGLTQVTLSRVIEVRFIRPGRTRPDGNRSCRSQAAIDVITGR
jgi:hypothetical protein